MKEIIALAVFAIVTVFTVVQVLQKKFGTGLAACFLCFAIVSGFAIANYDVITKLQWGDLRIEAARKEIEAAKDSAVVEIKDKVKIEVKKEVEAQVGEMAKGRVTEK